MHPFPKVPESCLPSGKVRIPAGFGNRRDVQLEEAAVRELARPGACACGVGVALCQLQGFLPHLATLLAQTAQIAVNKVRFLPAARLSFTPCHTLCSNDTSQLIRLPSVNSRTCSLRLDRFRLTVQQSTLPTSLSFTSNMQFSEVHCCVTVVGSAD